MAVAEIQQNDWHRRIACMKLKKNIFNIIIILMLAALIAGAVFAYEKIRQLETQLSYTTDNTAVILSNVETMKDDIKQTLQEEASLISDYSITLGSADFLNMTYTVNIDVAPKEYTESTEASVFFGTQEAKLELDGYKYIGTATLPMSNDYSGNVTFLFVDGSKRSTEVLSDFGGVVSLFDNVVSGVLASEPTFEDGNLSISSDVDVTVLNNSYFEFSEYELIVEVGESTTRTYDLLARMKTDGKFSDGSNDSTTDVGDSTETAVLTDTSDHSDGLEGMVKIDDIVPSASDANVRMYINVVSKQGYTFTYDLFEGTVNELNDEFESVDNIDNGNYAVFDANGYSYQPWK